MRATRERGVALILTFLVVIILVVVIGQMGVSSGTDVQLAKNGLSELQFEAAARGALEEASGYLLRDLKTEDEEAAASAPAGGGPLGSEGGDPFGGLPGGAEEGAENAQPTDSLTPDEEWANLDRLSYAQGQVEISLRIVDEERKLNVLTLLNEEKEIADEARERMIRLLDTFREDSKHDLSSSDAVSVVDGILDWLEGDRPDDSPVPKQAGAPMTEEEKAAAPPNQAPEHYYPFGLEELVRIDGFDESLLYGFTEDDGRVYVPGLADVLTVYTALTFDEEVASTEDEEGAGPGFQNPFGSSNTGGGPAGQTRGPSGSSGGPGSSPGGSSSKGGNTQTITGEDEDDADGAGDEDDADGVGDPGADPLGPDRGAVNVNTAPLAVLRALLPQEDMPWSVLDRVDEYRKKAFEENLDSAYQAIQKKKKEQGEEEDDVVGALEEDEDFLFDDPTTVFDKVEKHFDTNFDLEEQARARFAAMTTVKSHVFTVLIALRNTQNESGGGSGWTPSGTPQAKPDRVYRAVIWRRKSSDGHYQAVPLVPLHAWTGSMPPDDEEYKEKNPFGF